MTKGRALLWSPASAYAGGRFDGCSTRRRAILELLQKEEQWDILHLKSRGGLYDGTANLLRLLYFLKAGEGLDKLLMFYPDFPLFHPPRQLKVPLVCMVLQGVRTLLRKTKAKFYLDIVDLPRWQSKDLGYQLKMAPLPLKSMEKEILSLADYVVLPSQSLAQLLLDEGLVAKEKVKILPNGLPRKDLESLNKKAAGKPSFFYAGDLSLERKRNIRSLVDSFVSESGAGQVLHLCGEGGQWLWEGDYPAKVRYHGHLAEEACLELARSCDFGLIPYPEDDYYQWCFPSKLGLYLNAGLAVLSSELKETKRLIDQLQIGETKPIAQFSQFFRQSDDLLARYDKEEIKKRAATWDWETMAREVFDLG